MVDVLQLVVGLVALVAGGLVVRGASRLAVGLGMSPALVGATIVAFGTSMPEFLVSAVASAEGSAGLAIGNVLGSNVANVALVLGLGAGLGSLQVQRRLLRWEIPALGVATAFVLLIAANEVVSRLEGVVLLGLLLVFVVGAGVLSARSLRSREVGAAALPPGGHAASSRLDRGASLRELGQVLAGVLLLALGAELLVRGATGIAELFEVSEIVVGVAIVAVGTSLPEVATTAIATLRGEHEIAVGNAIGSNVFNLLGVLGLAAVVAPLEVDPRLFEFELPALVLSTAILVPLALRGRLRRPDGLLLVLLYCAFIAVTVVRG